jgi:cytidylate kinase
MTTASSSRDPALSRLVEKHMRNLEIARTQHHDDVAEPVAVKDFVAISRMVGSGGRAVAEAIARELDWPLLDREILQAMAGDDDIRQRLYESMDERDLTWFELAVRALPSNRYTANDYFRQLSHTILMLARSQHAIFLGRAADLILPRDRGMRVRLIAGIEHRIQRYGAARDCGLDDAREAVKRIEEERARFIASHFHVDALDPLRHDLVINLDRWTTTEAARIILAAVEQRNME